MPPCVAHVTGLDVRYGCSSVPCVACVIGCARKMYLYRETDRREVRKDGLVGIEQVFLQNSTFLAR